MSLIKNPVLSKTQAAAILARSKEHLPTALEYRTDPPDLGDELAILRAHIRDAGRKTTPILVMITMKMAQAMLSLHRKKNRKLNRAWIAQLRKVMLEGRFKPDAADFIFDWDGDLRDGRHRLNAAIDTGSVFSAWVKFGVDPDTFQAIDVGRKRNAAQFLDLDDVKHAHLIAAISRLIYRIDHNGELPDHQRVYLDGKAITDDAMQRAVRASGRLRRDLSAIPSSSALAYWTIAAQSKRAHALDEFWDHLTEGHMLELNSPIYKLRKRFHDDARGKPKPLPQYLKQTSHAAWIIAAWNAWSIDQTYVSFAWKDENALPAVR